MEFAMAGFGTTRRMGTMERVEGEVSLDVVAS